MVPKPGEDIHSVGHLPAGGLAAVVGVVPSASDANENLRSRLGQHAPRSVAG